MNMCLYLTLPTPAGERFLPTRGTFRAISATKSLRLQPMLVVSVHRWPTPTGVGRVIGCVCVTCEHSYINTYNDIYHTTYGVQIYYV